MCMKIDMQMYVKTFYFFQNFKRSSVVFCSIKGCAVVFFYMSGRATTFSFEKWKRNFCIKIHQFQFTCSCTWSCSCTRIFRRARTNIITWKICTYCSLLFHEIVLVWAVPKFYYGSHHWFPTLMYHFSLTQGQRKRIRSWSTIRFIPLKI